MAYPYPQQPPPYGGPGYPYPPPPPPGPTVSLFGPHYVLPYETTLVIKEKFTMSGDDMDICDVTGVCHFKLKAKIFSLRDKRVIFNARGEAICSVMNKMLSLHSKRYICHGDHPSESTKVAEFRKVIFSLRPEGHIFFNGNHTDRPDIIIRGSFFELNFQFIDSTGRLLADVSRDMFGAKAIILGLQTYYLRVFPGVDSALMVVLVSIVEEAFVEDRNND